MSAAIVASSPDSCPPLARVPVTRLTVTPSAGDVASVLVLCGETPGKTLCPALVAEGYRVSLVEGAVELWAHLRRDPPDAVVLEVGPQPAAVLALCGEIRSQDATRHLPVVLVAPGEPTELETVAALRAGADDFVCTSRLLELRARVAVQLRHKRYQDLAVQLRSERDVLRVVAATDPLTRIPNRGALTEEVRERMERASPFAVLFLDLDHFKSVNDDYGHDAGDEVLRTVGEFLKRSIGPKDSCARYGGEEFVVVVDGANAVQAMRVAERYRMGVSQLVFGPGGPRQSLTVSIGVAAFDPALPDLRLESLLRRADEALYSAKRAGRNRVVLAAASFGAIGSQSILPSSRRSVAPRASAAHSGIDVHHTFEEVEEQLLAQLEDTVAGLPLLPSVAAEALRLASDPDADLRRFAVLVDRDPHIAARFASIANSALYSRGMRTSSTRDAVLRVGLGGARDILFQLVYSASSLGMPRFQDQVAQSFRRSVQVAVAARAASKAMNAPCLYDYLAGLLHDIGEARIYRILAVMKPECTDEQADRLVALHHCEAGGSLAVAWGLPDEIVRTCVIHHGEIAADPTVRAVQCGDAIVASRSEAGEQAIALDPAFGLSDEAVQAILADIEAASVDDAATAGSLPPTLRWTTRPDSGRHRGRAG